MFHQESFKPSPCHWPEISIPAENVSTVRKLTGAPTPYRKKLTFQKVTMTQAGPHLSLPTSHPSSYPVSQSGDMRQKDEKLHEKAPQSRAEVHAFMWLTTSLRSHPPGNLIRYCWLSPALQVRRRWWIRPSLSLVVLLGKTRQTGSTLTRQDLEANACDNLGKRQKGAHPSESSHFLRRRNWWRPVTAFNPGASAKIGVLSQ